MSAHDERVCEWYECDHIQKIDELVEKFDKSYAGVTIESGYMGTFNAIHLADWKNEFKNWMHRLIEDLESIVDEVDELPDDEFELYLEVGDTYTGIEEEEEDSEILIHFNSKELNKETT